MFNRLKSFLIEIECPSGAKLVGDLSRVAHAMALEFYINQPKGWLPQGAQIPSDIYAYIREDEGRALSFIFGMPWDALLRVMNYLKVEGEYDDHAAWNTMQRVQLSGEGGPNPFLARVIPKPDEVPDSEVSPSKILSEDDVAIILHTLKDTVKHVRAVNVGPEPSDSAWNKAQALSRLDTVVEALDKGLKDTPAPNPVLILIRCPSLTHEDLHPSCQLNPVTGDYSCLACGAKGNLKASAPAADGWGHAKDAETVSDLLREGDAMLKGTDKHEQMFKGTDEEIQQQRLALAIEKTNRSLREQMSTLAQHTKLLAAHAEAINSLQSNQGGMTSTLQKLHRRMKLGQITVAYGAPHRPFTAPDLSDPHDPVYERDLVYRSMCKAALAFGDQSGTFTARGFADAFKESSRSDVLLDQCAVRGLLRGRRDVITLRGGVHYQIIG